MVRNEYIRLWIGPQTGLGVLDLFEDYYFTFGFVVGLNIHLNDLLSLTADAGVNGIIYWGSQKVLFNFHTGFEVYGRIGIAFRFNDTFNRVTEE